MLDIYVTVYDEGRYSEGTEGVKLSSFVLTPFRYARDMI